jgi:hypothetical protein
MEGKKPTKLDRLIFAGIIVLAIGCGAYYYGQDIYRQDSADSERATGKSERQRTIDNYISSYQIAKRNSKTDACTQAAMVAGLFLGLKDEVNYRQWKATEVSDCKAPGIDMP